MYGLLFEILEGFVIEKQGLDVWHEIKEKAACEVADRSFLRRNYYTDEEWIALATAASGILGTTVHKLLEEFGRFCIHDHYDNGYDDLLHIQGSTLRQWLSNLNAMHDHIEKTFSGDKFVAPVYWCEDDDDVNGAILLHYYSQRGVLLVPLTVGIVKESSIYQFGVEVNMTQLALQDEDGSTFTTWRIEAVDPSQQWKLASMPEDVEEVPDFANVELPKVCPFSGRALGTPAATGESTGGKCSFPHQSKTLQEEDALGLSFSSMTTTAGIGLSLKKLKTVFPFHILVDKDFTILQVGSTLPRLLSKQLPELIGKHIGDIMDITRPVLGNAWEWKALRKLADQNFFLAPKSKESGGSLKKKVSMQDSHIRFTGSMIDFSSNQVMFALSPSATNVVELRSMGLSLDDLPLHSNQRDVVFLGEYIVQEVDKAHTLDLLSKTLEHERKLSNALLHNMLPPSVADELRKGITVQPKHYDHVTCFFSDVVGFTSICARVDPWAVIDMLNQLYSVMDFLATEFNLYKVETIGDAYMAVSGLPLADDKHAENVANFAIAAQECVQHVKSPVDGSPILLRIGIHTGDCTAGVVGTLTPHFCLFGDLVNTTSRHESTGVAGKIQCSSFLFGQLRHFSSHEKAQYDFTPRGLVHMKGKGDCYTYWLEGATVDNEKVNPHSLARLSEEVEDMLAKKTWKMRKYFRKSGALRGGEASSSGLSSGISSSKSDSMSESDGISEADYLTSDGEEKKDDTVAVKSDDELNSVAERPEDPTSQVNFSELVISHSATREDLVALVHQITSPLFHLCLSCSSSDEETAFHSLDGQLYRYIDEVSKAYSTSNAFRNFLHTAHVILWSEALFKRAQSNSIMIYDDPWYRFSLVFAALVADCQHQGVTDEQLEKENHPLSRLYPTGNCQERFSVDWALNLLSEEYPELQDEFMWGCPRFMHLVRKAVIATDTSSDEAREVAVAALNKAMKNTGRRPRDVAARTEAVLTQVLVLATIGHCIQPNGTFAVWNELAFDEELAAFHASRGNDPRRSWHLRQLNFFHEHVSALMEQLLPFLPSSCGISYSLEHNLKAWSADDKREDLLPVHCKATSNVAGTHYDGPRQIHAI